jgi:hypothetical protein
MKESATEIRIYSYWWIDNFEEATRYSRTSKTDALDLRRLELRGTLQDALSSLLSWPPNEWTEITSGFTQAWSGFTKEDFMKVEDSYSIPKTNDII